MPLQFLEDSWMMTRQSHPRLLGSGNHMWSSESPSDWGICYRASCDVINVIHIVLPTRTTPTCNFRSAIFAPTTLGIYRSSTLLISCGSRPFLATPLVWCLRHGKYTQIFLVSAGLKMHFLGSVWKLVLIFLLRFFWNHDGLGL